MRFGVYWWQRGVLSVIAELALSPPHHIINGVRPPDECISLRQPAFKDPWRIREALSVVSLTFLPSLSASPRLTMAPLAFLHIQIHQKLIQLCKDAKPKSQACAFFHINKLNVFCDQRGNKSFKGPLYLICVLVSLSSWPWVFSAPLSLLHFTASPPGVFGARRSGRTLTLRMKCSSVFSLVAVFLTKMLGRRKSRDLEKGLFFYFLAYFKENKINLPK